MLWKNGWSSVELNTSLLRGNVFYSLFLQFALGSIFVAFLCTSLVLSFTHIYCQVVCSFPSPSLFPLPYTPSLYSSYKLQHISLCLTTFPSGRLFVPPPDFPLHPESPSIQQFSLSSAGKEVAGLKCKKLNIQCKGS